MVTELTAGRPIKVLLAFSLPMLIGNVIQQFYNMVDLIIVGNFIGVDALAAVGATNSTMFLMFSLVIGLTNGASVVVAQHYGAGDIARVKRAVATSIYALATAAAIFTVIGVAITEPVLRLLNTPEEILDGAVAYLVVILAGIFAVVAYNGAANIIRALGDSITPLIFLVVAVVLNIFLDILFIVTFEMGVAGAAWATVLAQVIAAAACMIYAYWKMPILRLKREDFVPDKEILGQTIRIGVPSGLQNSLMAIGGMTIQSVVNTFGSQIMAAFAAAVKLDQLAVQPMLTLAMASSTYTAQNMGAGKIERVRKGLGAAIVLVAAFCLVITSVLYIFGGNLLQMFMDSGETQVLEAGMGYLRVVSLFYVVLGVIVVLEGMLRGAGDVVVPVFSNLMEIVVRIAVAYGFAAMFGYAGIWWSGPISWIIGTIICGIRYFSGKWQYKALTAGPSEEMKKGTP